jgi:hypothetical protein
MLFRMISVKISIRSFDIADFSLSSGQYCFQRVITCGANVTEDTNRPSRKSARIYQEYKIWPLGFNNIKSRKSEFLSEDGYPNSPSLSEVSGFARVLQT